jgi:hypothetical protein
MVRRCVYVVVCGYVALLLSIRGKRISSWCTRSIHVVVIIHRRVYVIVCWCVYVIVRWCTVRFFRALILFTYILTLVHIPHSYVSRVTYIVHLKENAPNVDLGCFITLAGVVPRFISLASLWNGLGAESVLVILFLTSCTFRRVLLGACAFLCRLLSWDLCALVFRLVIVCRVECERQLLGFSLGRRVGEDIRGKIARGWDGGAGG